MCSAAMSLKLSELLWFTTHLQFKPYPRPSRFTYIDRQKSPQWHEHMAIELHTPYMERWGYPFLHLLLVCVCRPSPAWSFTGEKPPHSPSSPFRWEPSWAPVGYRLCGASPSSLYFAGSLGTWSLGHALTPPST